MKNVPLPGKNKVLNHLGDAEGDIGELEMQLSDRYDACDTKIEDLKNEIKNIEREQEQISSHLEEIRDAQHSLGNSIRFVEQYVEDVEEV